MVAFTPSSSSSFPWMTATKVQGRTERREQCLGEKSSSAWTYASQDWTLPFLLNLGKLTEVANKMRWGHQRVLCHHTLAFPAIL